MIPKYPFRVTTWRKIGDKLDMRVKSFETLAAAYGFADQMIRANDMRRVEVSCVLEDRHHDEAGKVAYIRSMEVR